MNHLQLFEDRFKKLSIELDAYQNNTHYADEFGSFWAADVAGKLFDKWGKLDIVASNHSYENENANKSADKAWGEYILFVSFVKGILDLDKKDIYPVEPMSIQDIELTQESFLLGAR